MVNESPSDTHSADSQLPPVQAPAGRFFVQLFLIPMLIVGAIVTLWVVVASIANMGTDPELLVSDIERVNSDSWRKALTLAQQLRDPEQVALRNNEDLAGRLATLLDRQVEAGYGDIIDATNARDKEGRLSLPIYLCSALGVFEVDTGAGALAKAATKERQGSAALLDVRVRRAALQGIGTLVANLAPAEIEANPELLKAVLKGADEYAEDGEEKIRRELLRSTATYVLGMFPEDAAIEKLGKLIHDPSLDVGYNAAIGLARHGDTRALPLLAEMLDPPPEALKDESIVDDQQDKNFEAKREGRKKWKRGHIMENALRAIAKIRTDHPSADIESIKPMVEALAKSKDADVNVQMLAKEVLRSWKKSSE